MLRLLCAAILALAGCALAAGGASAASQIGAACQHTSSSEIGPESESAAQLDAASLLAELSLPPGSSESSSEPAEDDSLLAGPALRPVTPNLVDEHTWWLVPAGPAEALTYVCAHLPAGTALDDFGGGLEGPDVPENENAGFTVPGNPGTLAVHVVRLPNGSTALRADAQVVWISPRPASDVLPAGAHLLRIAVHSPSGHHLGSFAPEPLLERLPSKVTSAARIQEIVALLNGLRVAQPGVRSCPLDRGGDVLLSFYASANAAPLALADINLGGCGGVSVMVGGLRQLQLEGGSEMIGPIAKILGVKADVGPPVGPVPHLSGVRMSRKRFGVIAEDIVTPGVEPGSEFLFTLSAPAEVSVAISRLPRGARYADTCRAVDAIAPRHAEGCLRTVVVDRFTRLTEPEGQGAIRFSGFVGRRPLALGRYVALLKARNTGGGSRGAHVEFEITH